jgi:uncharacterized protein involved in outer membrane biogenesis
MKKALIWIFAGLFALVVAALVVSVFSLGSVVKSRVETVGSVVTQVPVELHGASVWLVPGRVDLVGLDVGNPPGWKNTLAVKVGDIAIRVKPLSALSEKTIIDSITVKSPEITFEGGLRNNNLAQIRKNVNAYVHDTSSAPPPAETSATEAASTRKFQINDLVITGAQLHVISLFSSGQNITISLPEIHLTNLGANGQGITSPEVAEKALTSLLNSIAANAANVLPKFSKDAATAAKKFDLKKAAERVKSWFGQ